jgi:hypothetical protein
MPPFVTEPRFDENSEEELWAHGLTIEHVFQLIEESPKFFQQRNGRVRIVGPDRSGRLITAIIEYPNTRGSAYVITGWVADTDERTRYGRLGGRTNE